MKTIYHRRLPHIQPRKSTFFITFRLYGSLPKSVVQRLKSEHETAIKNIEKQVIDPDKAKALIEAQKKKYFGKFDAYLDRISDRGPVWLNIPRIATMVCDAIRSRDGQTYDLISYTVMPNHVHLLFSQLDTRLALFQILKTLKGFTARQANLMLERTGQPFWQSESYDHLVRSGDELFRIIDYILQNPVKAKLVCCWEDWPFSYLKDNYLHPEI